MSGKTKLSFVVPLIAATLQAGCMTSQSDSRNDLTCRVDGAQHLSDSAGEVDLCARFQERFYQVMGDAGVEIGEDEQLSFALVVQKSGTIDAVVSKSREGVQTPYPTVSVDVMDRGLNMSDIDRVAEAAGQMVMNELAGQAAPGS